jgi:hypothetical protein
MASGLKRRAAGLLGRLATPVLLRLSLGAVPEPGQRAAFLRGFAFDPLHMPPLPRGLLAMPGGRQILRDAATYAWHKERGSLIDGATPDLGGNVFTAWTGRGVSFLHIEKCGGTALMRGLAPAFHPLQIYPDDHRDLPPHLMMRTPAFLGLHPAQYPLIWGHYDVPTLQRFAPGHFVFTLLREPKARVLSLYHFWRSVDPAAIDPDLSFSVSLAHRLSLEDFLACDDPMLLDLIDNLYARRLTGVYATGAAEDPVRGTADQAMAVLGQLSFVGITERLDDSMARLAALLDISAPAAPLRANVTAENHRKAGNWFRKIERADISAAAARLLERRTELDAALYAKAVADFDTGA